jgi:hypothetical protein
MTEIIPFLDTREYTLTEKKDFKIPSIGLIKSLTTNVKTILKINEILFPQLIPIEIDGKFKFDFSNIRDLFQNNENIYEDHNLIWLEDLFYSQSILGLEYFSNLSNEVLHHTVFTKDLLISLIPVVTDENNIESVEVIEEYYNRKN